MRSIVTGGAGFIGSNLCNYLLTHGQRVVCIDNLLTGSKKNIEPLLQNPQFTFLEHDVCKPLPSDLAADWLFHLASPASPNEASPKSYHALPLQTMQVNTFGTWLLADFAAQKKMQFLFASTSEVYGDPTEHPQKETYRGNVSTTGPRSVYDEAKRFGETIVASFVRSKQLNGRIIRIFNTYGPNMALDDGRLTVESVKHAVANEPLPIFGDGNQTRAFCYVDDLVIGIVKAMETPNTNGEIFNLGNPEEHTVLEFAQMVIAVLQSTSAIQNTRTLPQDDPLQRCPDITKAKTILGWQPTVPLAEGIKRMAQYIKEQ